MSKCNRMTPYARYFTHMANVFKDPSSFRICTDVQKVDTVVRKMRNIDRLATKDANDYIKQLTGRGN